MVRILRAVKVLLMTVDALRGHSRVFAADVALDAIDGGVRAGQRETGKRVVEPGSHPGCHVGVALLAVGREPERHVIGVLGGRIPGNMAARAIGRQAGEFAGGSARVAGVALDQRVRTQQWKTVLVLAHRLDGACPAHDVVALFALRSQLASMNVGVAVGAGVANLGKHRTGVTLGARNILVHALEREVGFAVVEIRIVADGFPGREGVAVLAGNVERPVWTASLLHSAALFSIALILGAHHSRISRAYDGKHPEQQACRRHEYQTV